MLVLQRLSGIKKHHHKYACEIPTHKQYIMYVHKFIRSHGGWTNWRMILIEQYECLDKQPLITVKRTAVH
jgi:hypothetical protein